MARRKPKFRVGQRVFCINCNKWLKILTKKFDKSFDVWTYATNKTEVAKLKRSGTLAHLSGDFWGRPKRRST